MLAARRAAARLNAIAGTAPPTRRLCSRVTLDAGEEEVAELLDRSLAKKDRQAGSGVLTTRREALHLYRDVLRASRLFVWQDERGSTWREVIRTSARKEFEAARGETDPELVTRLLVSGRDSLQQALQKFMAKRDAIQQEEAGPPPPGGPSC